MKRTSVKNKDPKCKKCKLPFKPFNTFEKMCVPCAIKKGRENNRNKAERSNREFDKETVRRKKELRDNDKGFQMSSAQDAFNKFIRQRDHDKPCISCDRVFVEWTRGGQWDCGHYKSRGGYPELRFCELNAHKQCKSCNGGSSKYARKGKTVGEDYTARLIERIGADKVEWLNGPHELNNYTAEDYKAIKKTYNQKYRDIIKDQE